MVLNRPMNQPFYAAWAAIPKEVPFNPKWHDGTGFFDPAVRGDFAPNVPIGEFVKCTTDDNRKLILQGTRFGNVAVFERVSGVQDVIMASVPATVYELFEGSTLTGGGALSEEMTRLLLGDLTGLSNIGNKLEDLLTVY